MTLVIPKLNAADGTRWGMSPLTDQHVEPRRYEADALVPIEMFHLRREPARQRLVVRVLSRHQRCVAGLKSLLERSRDASAGRPNDVNAVVRSQPLRCPVSRTVVGDYHLEPLGRNRLPLQRAQHREQQLPVLVARDADRRP